MVTAIYEYAPQEEKTSPSDAQFVHVSRLRHFRNPILLDLSREPQKASYQVCVLGPEFGILQMHRLRCLAK